MDIVKAKKELNDFLTENPSLWGCSMIPNPVGPKQWIVHRDNDTPWPKVHVDSSGKAIRYTEEGALKKAVRLNEEEMEKREIHRRAEKGRYVRSLLELQEEIEDKTKSIVYRVRNSYRVDPELSKDLHEAVDAFLAKVDEYIKR